MTSTILPQNEPSWHATIVRQLEDRDRREKHAFTRLFDAHNNALHNLSSLAERNNELEMQLAALRLEHSQAVKAAEMARELGSPEAASRYAEMAEELKTLKAECADLYKTQAQNAQRSLELVDTVKIQEEHIKRLTDENAALRASGAGLSRKLEDALASITEKEHTFQILHDELAAHQLELVQKDEQLKEKEERLKRLEAENKQLVDRWILLKQQEAARMNEANEFVESALKSKMSAAAQSPPTPSPLTSRISNKDVLADLRKDSRLRAVLPNGAVRKFTSHDGEINCISINRDGSLVATGGNDKKLILHDARTGSSKATLVGSMQAVMCVSFNSSDLVLGTSNDNSTKIWSISTSRLKHTLTGHIGKVYSAKFTESNRVISGSHDRTIKIWDLAKGYCLKTIFTLSSCNDLTPLDGDGTVIVSGHLDNNVRVWDGRSGNLVREITGIHHGQITSVEISPHQNYMLTTSRDNTLKLIDTRMFETVTVFSEESFRTGLNWSKSCFSPDGMYVASGAVDGSVYIWNVESGRCELVLSREHKSTVCGVVWNPQGGSAVYSADKDRTVVCWGSI